MEKLLKSQWHPVKNNGLTLDDFTLSSKAKAWWVCDKGHDYESVIGNRYRGSGCPYCANKKVFKGFNDLASLYPDIAQELNVSRNSVKADEIIAGGQTKLWWVCDMGHEWEAAVKDRIRGNKCPYCSNKKILQGFNDLATTYPSLLSDWDYDKNTILPTEISAGSDRKVFWKCNNGHSYDMKVHKKRIGQKCPYCSGKRYDKESVSFSSKYPNLYNMFVKSFNKGIVFDELNANDDEEIIWFHERCGRTFSRIVKDMVRDSTCTFCRDEKKEVVWGLNDLQSSYPSVAVLWNNDKNELSPDEIFFNSSVMCFWKCQRGHEWSARVSSMVNGYSQCYECDLISIQDKKNDVFEYLSMILHENIVRDFVIGESNDVVDFFIPALNIAVNFNSLFMGSEVYGVRRYDRFNMWQRLFASGVRLITIWEDEWDSHRTIIEKMLSHKLNVSQDKRVFARQTDFVNVSASQAKIFLDRNHIQGYKNITQNYGLRDKKSGNIVAVISYSLRDNVLNLDRYATDCVVVGGFTKLLNHSLAHLVERHPHIDSVLTFADYSVSDGGLYDASGFVVDSVLKPDYMYVHNHQREHKFNYRLKRFRNDAGLVYNPEMTESQLAQLNSILKVWDYGKIRYVKSLSKNC